MRCPNCGKENSEGSKSCQHCGHQFAAPGPSAPAGSKPAAIPETRSAISQAPRTSGMAIASLVLGILGGCSFGLAGIVGLILGIIAYREIGRSQGQIRGKGMAITGIILGALFPVFIFLGIMAAIAIPNFLRFQARAKQSEAKQNLGAIFTAYAAYYADNNTYPTAPMINVNGKDYNCLAIADWEPKGRIRYTYECMGTVAYHNDQIAPSESCGGNSGADQTSFTISACGNIDADSTLDVWTINDSKVLINVVNDVRE